MFEILLKDAISIFLPFIIELLSALKCEEY